MAEWAGSVAAGLGVVLADSRVARVAAVDSSLARAAAVAVVVLVGAPVAPSGRAQAAQREHRAEGPPVASVGLGRDQRLVPQRVGCRLLC